ncbi:hypothetical protein JQ636_37945 [Bradyrhizobium japonicum]|uniref:hypothetical protein n=1 Tax=Bradyrhizobium japonicum TaxID=375 RepID=UPI001BAA86BB|nr:hypothetical protein [Bradyrhizobium japonicum]MBR0809346.1 hypothetical protein [Bradyrhizobium japonicum]
MPRRSSLDIAFPERQASRLSPPDDLTGPARTMFLDIVTSVRPDFFQPAHRPLLAAYANALAEERVAAGELEANYIVDGKASPWLAIWQARMRAVTTLARALRLSPASQHAPEAKEPPPPVSAYERMALEAQRDGRN